MRIININPSIVYFTHSRIRQRFTGCGKLLQETLAELREDQSKIQDIPKIKVIYDDERDAYYSMNNRRLWVFKKLYDEGLVKEIPVYFERIKENSKMRKNQYSLVAKVDKK